MALRIRFYIGGNADDLVSCVALVRERFPMLPPDDIDHRQAICSLLFEDVVWFRNLEGEDLRSVVQEFIHWKDSVSRMITQ